MNFDIYIVLFTIILIIISLYKEIASPVAIFFLSVVVFCATGILSPHDVLEGFSNEQIAVIVLLLIIGNIIERTSVADLIFSQLFKRNSNYYGFLGRMIGYVSLSSAFFNNTPLVAMMMPFVHNWSKKKGIAPSKLLIPLSYAAILGGCATLVGTSTNLIVNGMAVQNGITEIGIFDFAYVGIPMIILGFLYLFFFSYRLLPDRKDAIDNFTEKSREYLAETVVMKNSYLIGKTVEEANLRNLKGLFLVEIRRGRHCIAPVSPSRILQAKDRLIFAGETDKVVDLLKEANGLTIPETGEIALQKRSNIIEVVISQNSNLVDIKVKKINFRSKYDAAIVAVHRNGEKLSGKIGDIYLNSGDVLLLLAGKNFVNQADEEVDFYYISNVNEIHNIKPKQRIVLMGGLMAAIALSAFNIFSLFKGLLVLLALIVIFRIATLKEIKRSIAFKIIAIDCMSLAVGQAMINSGAAQFLAEHILDIFRPFGVVGLLAGVYITTNILASYMTNVAAVSIIFPISLSLANQLLSAGHISSVIPFILIVAFGGAANFITPIGYQTNLMVYGSGSYSFKDFFKIGLPLAILYMITAVTVLSWVYDL